MPETNCEHIVGFLERNIVEDFYIALMFQETNMEKEFTQDELNRIIKATRIHRPHLFIQFFATQPSAIKEIKSCIKNPKFSDEIIINAYKTLLKYHQPSSEKLTPVHNILKKHRPDLNNNKEVIRQITRCCYREVINS